jgi:hypothetical protein
VRYIALSIVAAAAFAAASAAASAQDFTIRMRNDGGDTSTTSTYYVRQDAVRYTNAAVNADVIYRLDQNVAFRLDARSKTYRTISPSEALSGTGTPGGGPPKELFHRLGFDAAPTVTRLGAGETIAGYATQKCLVATAAIRVEISVAPSLEMPAAYYDANAMFKRATLIDMTRFDREMRQIKGVVLRRSMTVSLPGGMQGQQYTETAISVDRNPIPMSTYEIPAAYRAAN